MSAAPSSLSRRLAALEAAETQRAATQADADYKAAEARRKARLRDMGINLGDYYTVCECCSWKLPGLARFSGAIDDMHVNPCLICGAAVYGPVAPRRSDYFPEARYSCPRCRHSYTGPRFTLTPCPACCYVPPAQPEGDSDEAIQHYVAAVAVGLCVVHGAPAALAWLDVADDERRRGELEQLSGWWLEDVPREWVGSAQAFLAGDGYHVAATYRMPAGYQAGAPLSDVASFTLTPSPYGATWEPEERHGARWLDRLLEALARAQGRPLPSSREEVRALLEPLAVAIQGRNQ